MAEPRSLKWTSLFILYFASCHVQADVNSYCWRPPCSWNSHPSFSPNVQNLQFRQPGCYSGPKFMIDTSGYSRDQNKIKTIYLVGYDTDIFYFFQTLVDNAHYKDVFVICYYFDDNNLYYVRRIFTNYEIFLKKIAVYHDYYVFDASKMCSLQYGKLIKILKENHHNHYDQIDLDGVPEAHSLSNVNIYRNNNALINSNKLTSWIQHYAEKSPSIQDFHQNLFRKSNQIGTNLDRNNIFKNDRYGLPKTPYRNNNYNVYAKPYNAIASNNNFVTSTDVRDFEKQSSDAVSNVVDGKFDSNHKNNKDIDETLSQKHTTSNDYTSLSSDFGLSNPSFLNQIGSKGEDKLLNPILTFGSSFYDLENPRVDQKLLSELSVPVDPQRQSEISSSTDSSIINDVSQHLPSSIANKQCVGSTQTISDYDVPFQNKIPYLKDEIIPSELHSNHIPNYGNKKSQRGNVLFRYCPIKEKNYNAMTEIDRNALGYLGDQQEKNYKVSLFPSTDKDQTYLDPEPLAVRNNAKAINKADNEIEDQNSLVFNNPSLLGKETNMPSESNLQTNCQINEPAIIHNAYSEANVDMSRNPDDLYTEATATSTPSDSQAFDCQTPSSAMSIKNSVDNSLTSYLDDQLPINSVTSYFTPESAKHGFVNVVPSTTVGIPGFNQFSSYWIPQPLTQQWMMDTLPNKSSGTGVRAFYSGAQSKSQLSPNSLKISDHFLREKLQFNPCETNSFEPSDINLSTFNHANAIDKPIGDLKIASHNFENKNKDNSVSFQSPNNYVTLNQKRQRPNWLFYLPYKQLDRSSVNILSKLSNKQNKPIFDFKGRKSLDRFSVTSSPYEYNRAYAKCKGPYNNGAYFASTTPYINYFCHNNQYLRTPGEVYKFKENTFSDNGNPTKKLWSLFSFNPAAYSNANIELAPFTKDSGSITYHQSKPSTYAFKDICSAKLNYTESNYRTEIPLTPLVTAPNIWAPQTLEVSSSIINPNPRLQPFISNKNGIPQVIPVDAQHYIGNTKLTISPTINAVAPKDKTSLAQYSTPDNEAPYIAYNSDPYRLQNPIKEIVPNLESNYPQASINSKPKTLNRLSAKYTFNDRHSVLNYLQEKQVNAVPTTPHSFPRSMVYTTFNELTNGIKTSREGPYSYNANNFDTTQEKTYSIQRQKLPNTLHEVDSNRISSHDQLVCTKPVPQKQTMSIGTSQIHSVSNDPLAISSELVPSNREQSRYNFVTQHNSNVLPSAPYKFSTPLVYTNFNDLTNRIYNLRQAPNIYNPINSGFGTTQGQSNSIHNGGLMPKGIHPVLLNGNNNHLSNKPNRFQGQDQATKAYLKFNLSDRQLKVAPNIPCSYPGLKSNCHSFVDRVKPQNKIPLQNMPFNELGSRQVQDNKVPETLYAAPLHGGDIQYFTDPNRIINKYPLVYSNSGLNCYRGKVVADPRTLLPVQFNINNGQNNKLQHSGETKNDNLEQQKSAVPNTIYYIPYQKENYHALNKYQRQQSEVINTPIYTPSVCLQDQNPNLRKRIHASLLNSGYIYNTYYPYRKISENSKVYSKPIYKNLQDKNINSASNLPDSFKEQKVQNNFSNLLDRIKSPQVIPYRYVPKSSGFDPTCKLSNSLQYEEIPRVINSDSLSGVVNQYHVEPNTLQYPSQLINNNLELNHPETQNFVPNPKYYIPEQNSNSNDLDKNQTPQNQVSSQSTQNYTHSESPQDQRVELPKTLYATPLNEGYINYNIEPNRIMSRKPLVCSNPAFNYHQDQKNAATVTPYSFPRVCNDLNGLINTIKYPSQVPCSKIYNNGRFDSRTQGRIPSPYNSGKVSFQPLQQSIISKPYSDSFQNPMSYDVQVKHRQEFARIIPKSQLLTPTSSVESPSTQVINAKLEMKKPVLKMSAITNPTYDYLKQEENYNTMIKNRRFPSRAPDKDMPIYLPQYYRQGQRDKMARKLYAPLNNRQLSQNKAEPKLIRSQDSLTSSNSDYNVLQEKTTSFDKDKTGFIPNYLITKSPASDRDDSKNNYYPYRLHYHNQVNENLKINIPEKLKSVVPSNFIGFNYNQKSPCKVLYKNVQNPSVASPKTRFSFPCNRDYHKYSYNPNTIANTLGFSYPEFKYPHKQVSNTSYAIPKNTRCGNFNNLQSSMKTTSTVPFENTPKYETVHFLKEQKEKSPKLLNLVINNESYIQFNAAPKTLQTQNRQVNSHPFVSYYIKPTKSFSSAPSLPTPVPFRILPTSVSLPSCYKLYNIMPPVPLGFPSKVYHKPYFSSSEGVPSYFVRHNTLSEPVSFSSSRSYIEPSVSASKGVLSSVPIIKPSASVAFPTFAPYNIPTAKPSTVSYYKPTVSTFRGLLPFAPSSKPLKSIPFPSFEPCYIAPVPSGLPTALLFKDPSNTDFANLLSSFPSSKPLVYIEPSSLLGTSNNTSKPLLPSSVPYVSPFSVSVPSISYSNKPTVLTPAAMPSYVLNNKQSKSVDPSFLPFNTPIMSEDLSSQPFHVSYNIAHVGQPTAVSYNEPAISASTNLLSTGCCNNAKGPLNLFSSHNFSPVSESIPAILYFSKPLQYISSGNRASEYNNQPSNIGSTTFVPSPIVSTAHPSLASQVGVEQPSTETYNKPKIIVSKDIVSSLPNITPFEYLTVPSFTPYNIPAVSQFLPSAVYNKIPINSEFAGLKSLITSSKTSTSSVPYNFPKVPKRLPSLQFSVPYNIPLLTNNQTPSLSYSNEPKDFASESLISLKPSNISPTSFPSVKSFNTISVPVSAGLMSPVSNNKPIDSVSTNQLFSLPNSKRTLSASEGLPLFAPYNIPTVSIGLPSTESMDKSANSVSASLVSSLPNSKLSECKSYSSLVHYKKPKISSSGSPSTAHFKSCHDNALVFAGGQASIAYYNRPLAPKDDISSLFNTQPIGLSPPLRPSLSVRSPSIVSSIESTVSSSKTFPLKKPCNISPGPTYLTSFYNISPVSGLASSVSYNKQIESPFSGILSSVARQPSVFGGTTLFQPYKILPVSISLPSFVPTNTKQVSENPHFQDSPVSQNVPSLKSQLIPSEYKYTPFSVFQNTEPVSQAFPSSYNIQAKPLNLSFMKHNVPSDSIYQPLLSSSATRDRQIKIPNYNPSKAQEMLDRLAIIPFSKPNHGTSTKHIPITSTVPSDTYLSACISPGYIKNYAKYIMLAPDLSRSGLTNKKWYLPTRPISNAAYPALYQSYPTAKYSFTGTIPTVGRTENSLFGTRPYLENNQNTEPIISIPRNNIPNLVARMSYEPHTNKHVFGYLRDNSNKNLCRNPFFAFTDPDSNSGLETLASTSTTGEEVSVKFTPTANSFGLPLGSNIQHSDTASAYRLANSQRDTWLPSHVKNCTCLYKFPSRSSKPDQSLLKLQTISFGLQDNFKHNPSYWNDHSSLISTFPGPQSTNPSSGLSRIASSTSPYMIYNPKKYSASYLRTRPPNIIDNIMPFSTQLFNSKKLFGSSAGTGKFLQYPSSYSFQPYQTYKKINNIGSSCQYSPFNSDFGYYSSRPHEVIYDSVLDQRNSNLNIAYQIFNNPWLKEMRNAWKLNQLPSRSSQNQLRNEEQTTKRGYKFSNPHHSFQNSRLLSTFDSLSNTLFGLSKVFNIPGKYDSYPSSSYSNPYLSHGKINNPNYAHNAPEFTVKDYKQDADEMKNNICFSFNMSKPFWSPNVGLLSTLNSLSKSIQTDPQFYKSGQMDSVLSKYASKEPYSFGPPLWSPNIGLLSKLNTFSNKLSELPKQLKTFSNSLVSGISKSFVNFYPGSSSTSPSSVDYSQPIKTEPSYYSPGQMAYDLKTHLSKKYGSLEPKVLDVGFLSESNLVPFSANLNSFPPLSSAYRIPLKTEASKLKQLKTFSISLASGISKSFVNFYPGSSSTSPSSVDYSQPIKTKPSYYSPGQMAYDLKTHLSKKNGSLEPKVLDVGFPSESNLVPFSANLNSFPPLSSAYRIPLKTEASKLKQLKTFSNSLASGISKSFVNFYLGSSSTSPSSVDYSQPIKTEHSYYSPGQMAYDLKTHLSKKYGSLEPKVLAVGFPSESNLVPFSANLNSFPPLSSAYRIPLKTEASKLKQLKTFSNSLASGISKSFVNFYPGSSSTSPSSVDYSQPIKTEHSYYSPGQMAYDLKTHLSKKYGSLEPKVLAVGFPSESNLVPFSANLNSFPPLSSAYRIPLKTEASKLKQLKTFSNSLASGISKSFVNFYPGSSSTSPSSVDYSQPIKTKPSYYSPGQMAYDLKTHLSKKNGSLEPKVLDVGFPSESNLVPFSANLNSFPPLSSAYRIPLKTEASKLKPQYFNPTMFQTPSVNVGQISALSYWQSNPSQITFMTGKLGQTNIISSELRQKDMAVASSMGITKPSITYTSYNNGYSTEDDNKTDEQGNLLNVVMNNKIQINQNTSRSTNKNLLTEKNNENQQQFAKNLNSNIANFLRCNEDIKADLLTTNNNEVTVPIGDIGIVKYNPNVKTSRVLKTSDPNIDIVMWPSKIKILKAKLVFEVEEKETVNFMPKVKDIAYVDRNAVRDVTTKYVTQNYGMPFVLSSVSWHKPYVVVLNHDLLHANNVFYIVWPMYKSYDV